MTLCNPELWEVIIMEHQEWNHLMEYCFSEFIDGDTFDAASESIFQLARNAFAKGYEVGVLSEKGRAHMNELNKLKKEEPEA